MTDSVRLDYGGDVLTAELIVDPDSTNAADVTDDGLFVAGPNETGWFPCGEAVTYAGADDPTYYASVVGDKTSKYLPGMRFRALQTTYRYFIITSVAYSGGTGLTTLTLYGGTDNDLTNTTIVDPVYSAMKAPTGFNPDASKWIVRLADTSDRAQATPVEGTWYNLGALSLTVPAGSWRLYFKGNVQIVSTGGGLGGRAALSTNVDSISDNDMSARAGWDSVNMNTGAWEVLIQKEIDLAIKTTYYALAMRDFGADGSISFRGASDGSTIISALCSLL